MYSFHEIIGHEQIIKHIKSAIKNKKVSHAYIIEGEKGIGKKLLANTFAKTLLCTDSDLESCNKCNSCINYDSLNHPDVKFVNATKKNIGVDDIREQLTSDINIKPYQSSYKIYIINNSNSMTVQAQNALLKTIEEPPHYGVILLLAENASMFLPTILSRCIMLKLRPIEEKKILEYLINTKKIDTNLASIYSSFARGNIGKAIELMDSDNFKKMREDIIILIDRLIKENEFKILQSYNILEQYKDNYNILFDLMLSWLRDLLLVKKIKEKKYLIHKDKYETLLKQEPTLSYNKINKLIDNIEHVRKNLKVNVNYQLSIETMLLNI